MRAFDDGTVIDTIHQLPSDSATPNPQCFAHEVMLTRLAKQGLLAEIIYRKARQTTESKRIVEPYRAIHTGGGERCFRCWQVSPEPDGGQHWRSFRIDRIVSVCCAEEEFSPREFSDHIDDLEDVEGQIDTTQSSTAVSRDFSGLGPDGHRWGQLIPPVPTPSDHDLRNPSSAQGSISMKFQVSGQRADGSSGQKTIQAPTEEEAIREAAREGLIANRVTCLTNTGQTKLAPFPNANGPTIICPNVNCGYQGPSRKVARGSAGTMILLFILGVLPGIIYAIVYNGHRLLCPKCGCHIRDET